MELQSTNDEPDNQLPLPELIAKLENNLLDTQTNLVDALKTIVELKQAILNESDTNGQQMRRGVKRNSDDPSDVEDECPNKMQKKSHDNNVANAIARNRTRKLMNINATMDRNTIHANLNEWLAQVYNRTAKFYTIKKCSRIGTVIFYIAIDVDLDETKDDIHVVINSHHLHRPHKLFQMIENCFQQRKVVTLLHILTNDVRQLRENQGLIGELIRTMMRPVVLYL